MKINPIPNTSQRLADEVLLAFEFSKRCYCERSDAIYRRFEYHQTQIGGSLENELFENE